MFCQHMCYSLKKVQINKVWDVKFTLTINLKDILNILILFVINQAHMAITEHGNVDIKHTLSYSWCYELINNESCTIVIYAQCQN